MKKKSIALVCTSLNELGGKNNHLKNIYLHLKKKNFDICIIACSKVEEDLRKFMIGGGVAEEDLYLIDHRKKLWVVPFIWELRHIFRVRKINIVHTFQEQSDVLGGVAAKLAGVKNIYSYYESKLIPENISLLKKACYRVMNMFLKNIFSKTVVVSKGLKEEIEKEQYRNLDTVEIVHLGINVPDGCSEIKVDRSLFEKGEVTIGTIGRFSFEKALDRFVRAMPHILKIYPNVRFVLVGEGPDKDELIHLARDMNVEKRLTFYPWTDDVFATLKDLDIFVMPSVREGCPTALLEAMAMARPIIASNIEGIRDVVDHLQTGLMIDTSDPASFAQAVIELLKNSQRAVEMGQRARTRILEDFTVQAEMNKLETLYNLAV